MDFKSYEAINPNVTVELNGKTIRYCTPTSAALWRAQTLLSKEPCTIQWLQEIRPGEILLDIGANVGMYSLYAAVIQEAKVIAFEPEAQNYALLNRNIHENKMDKQITAYCLGCSNETGFKPLYLSEFKAASSCHSMGAEVGFTLQYRKSPFIQGCYSISIDEAINQGAFPHPNHIKIDVDGFEHLVIKGAQKTLKNKSVSSLLVELNPNLQEHIEAVRLLNQLGFHESIDQVKEAARKDGPFKGVGEWIFRRSERPKLKTNKFKPEFSKAPLSIPGLTSQAKDVMKHVLARIVDTQPGTNRVSFPIATIDNVFPTDYYQQIRSHFPTDSSLTPINSSGRTSGELYRHRLVALFNDDDFGRLEPEAREFWSELASWLYNPRFINGVIKHFQDVVNLRMHRIAIQTGKPPVIRSDALIVSDHSGYAIGPHTDMIHRLVSFLFYLPEDDSQSHLGTSLYAPKDTDFSCEGGPHHKRDQFNRIETIEFLPNRLVLFPKTNRSFHGVEPISSNERPRRLLINNIRLIDG